jgi:hypothetical protein
VAGAARKLTAALGAALRDADAAAMAATPIYSQDRETHANAPAAEAAQLGPKLPAAPSCTADRVRASLILCPAR